MFAGGLVLATMLFMISVGPLDQLSLAEKLSLFQVLVATLGFALALTVALFLLYEFRRSIQRPLLVIGPLTRPVLQRPGLLTWNMQWNIRNEGSVACQWFSAELLVGLPAAEPRGEIRFTTWPPQARDGGAWVEFPAGVSQLPARFRYLSNGEITVFDAHGVNIGGPEFQLESTEREIEIWCIVRGAGSGARLYRIWLDPATGDWPKASETAMVRHPPGAR